MNDEALHSRTDGGPLEGPREDGAPDYPSQNQRVRAIQRGVTDDLRRFMKTENPVLLLASSAPARWRPRWRT